MNLPEKFETALTKKLGIRYPLMVAGMGHVTGADLASAVSNAGGIGTIGAIGMTVDGLRAEIKKLKSTLKPGNSIAGTLPFGVDLLLPQVGGNARKTNKDYTGGQLGNLVDMMIEEKVPLFVCAVGIPPVWVVEKMHANGMLVMNMAGHPKHVKKATAVGVDIICATGGEGGAHSGDISTLVLLPQCADMLAGTDTILVGGGGIFDGRGVSACFALGAEGVWVGTRYLASFEANSTPGYRQKIIDSTSADTRRIEIYSGRPLRVIKNEMNDYWAQNEVEMRDLLGKGVVPISHVYKSGEYMPGKKVPKGGFFVGPQSNKGFWNDVRNDTKPWNDAVDVAQAGQAIGGINEILSAEDITKMLLDGLIKNLQRMGQIGNQVPSRL